MVGEGRGVRAKGKASSGSTLEMGVGWGCQPKKKKRAGEMGAFVGHSLGLPWARRQAHAPRASQGPQARRTPA
jgi:hypothetical protein